ncbi:MAG: hypothetical protein FJX34_02055 [Alphaproteobacteria bacterium]|nr:hypothetical protein [Alphaproteobacteria bacterium]
MRELELYKQPASFLDKLTKSDKTSLVQIINTIEGLQKNPPTSSSKKLVGFKGFYRARCGKYRIIYKLNETTLHVLLAHTKHT